MQDPFSTDAQRSKLIAFRQAIYQEGFSKRRDAQFELLDALLLAGPLRSFPELSCMPVFRRRWSSVYAALDDGRQNTDFLRRYLAQQLPCAPLLVFALDGTNWPRPDAPTLPDRQYVYQPSAAVAGGTVVVGHTYSLLAYVAEGHSAWALPLDVERIASSQDAISCGIAQVKRLCTTRAAQLADCLHIIAADGKYGTHHFLRPLRDQGCGVLVRLRKDRVLYQPPPAYGGLGRPRVHGARFAFKEPETWGEPDEHYRCSDAEWGQVEIQCWHSLHAREAADTPFAALRIQVHLERDKPSEPLWVGWQGPDLSAATLWRAYQMRWGVEPSIRTRKQQLHWTLPAFQHLEASERWSMLVSLAQWMLYLARPLVVEQPLPWQAPQPQRTPGRVQRAFGVLFAQIGTPALPPKARGKSPGWPQGRKRRRPERHAVVKKATASGKKKKKPPGGRRQAA
jgi:DDE superfamily endonuclease